MGSVLIRRQTLGSVKELNSSLSLAMVLGGMCIVLRSGNNKILLVFISRVHKSFHGGVALEPALQQKDGRTGR